MQNRMHVKTKEGWMFHKFSFFNSMVDEKRDRGDSGLQGSGSKYLCTLCDADKQSAKALLGSFSIYRSVSECSNIAEILRVNPNALSENELKKISKGVKCAPLSKIEPIQKGIDATHADINLGQFCKKIVVREIAGVTKWEHTHYARSLFETPHSVLLKHISDSVRKDNLSSILNIFLHLRKVFRCKDPLTEFPFDVQN